MVTFYFTVCLYQISKIGYRYRYILDIDTDVALSIERHHRNKVPDSLGMHISDVYICCQITPKSLPINSLIRNI